ncbi:hypothetical protein EXU57_18845 [Segetibacter sp. 3557_3]|uniref:glutamate ligase domain-containing protein n=1 Tax=Segetibacter sp. 3557_3 TaxID=2547429 RepID=UPI0010590462|nr:cyanophycin synthetase [Segetibacter sp. 3557_3]TDH21568.1 hypothetical protein EXU57_18845 [Segetibacter sp. 3557_3]
MGATLAAYVPRIKMPAIRCTLRNFRNTSVLTPGRMNEYNFGDFTVMVDYAHNPLGLSALGEYSASVPATMKTGVITGVGDRRDKDIVAFGEVASGLFNEIVTNGLRPAGKN